MDQHDLLLKIRELHTQISWLQPFRDLGLIPNPAASPLAIERAEERMGRPLPPSYRAFLRLHDGWPRFFDGASLLGSAHIGHRQYEDLARAAFEAAARARGAGEVRAVVVPAPTTGARGRAALAALLAGDDPVDAVFCSSDLLALGVLTEAQARGIAVPERLAVVGFGDLEFAADLYPSLTTVRIDGEAIGRLAAEFIAARAEGRAVDQSVVDIGFSIVERESA